MNSLFVSLALVVQLPQAPIMDASEQSGVPVALSPRVDGLSTERFWPSSDLVELVFTADDPLDQLPPDMRAAVVDRSRRRRLVVRLDENSITRASCAGNGAVLRVQPAYFLTENDLRSARFENRVGVTPWIAIRVRRRADLEGLLRDYSLAVERELTYLPNTVLVRAAGADTIAIAAQIERQPCVIFAAPQLERRAAVRHIPYDPLFDYQWHLLNTGFAGGTPGADYNVAPVWDAEQGQGITIGIVDDGVEHTHPELSPAYVPSASYDFNDNDGDPTPNCTDGHGTAMAVIAAAQGDNALGTAGVAYGASLAGIRLIAAPFTDSDVADAMLWKNDVIDIKNNSWGPPDDGRSIAGPGPLTTFALRDAAKLGRGGLGTVITWAAGNGGIYDDANFDGYANSRFVIAIGASSNVDLVSNYSEPGANILVNGLSSGGSLSITCTDNVGFCGATASDYRTDALGTSAATGGVSGVIALMLHQNPNLSVRDVQHLLVRTSVKNVAGDPGWMTNGAGLPVHHRLGFGRVNAQAAVDLASGWNNVRPVITLGAGESALNLPIPDNNPSGRVRTLPISEHVTVEHVQVGVDVSHARRGDLRFELVSPAGTTSVVGRRPNDDDDDVAWTFMTVHNWGEDSDGTWTLRIIDGSPGVAGTLHAWSVTVYGTCQFDSCDANCDGSVNIFDIGPFLDLVDGIAQPCSACAGDADYNGTVNPFDLNAFVECLSN